MKSSISPARTFGAEPSKHFRVTPSNAKVIQQLFRCDKIGGAEAFGKSVIARLEAGSRVGRPAKKAQ